MNPDEDARLGQSIAIGDVPVAAAMVDRVGFVVASNDDFAALTGLGNGSSISDVVAEAARPRLVELVIDDGLGRSVVLPLVEREGGPVIAEFRVAHNSSSGDAVVFVLPRDAGVDALDDVAARSTGHHDLGVLIENDGELVHVSSVAADVFGRTRGDILGVGSLDGLLAPDERQRLDGLVAERQADGNDRPVHAETIIERGDGALVPVELWISASPGEPASRRVTLVADATGRAERHAWLAHAALYDELTGLANRALLHDRLSGLLNRMLRTPSTGAVCVLDLDGFRPVNDELGVRAGDEVLRIIGARLTSRLRPSDTVARVGDDEFAVLFEDVADDVPETELAERIRAIVAEPIVGPGWEVEIEASIGTVLVDDPSLEAAQLLEFAESRMFDDKNSRR